MLQHSLSRTVDRLPACLSFTHAVSVAHFFSLSLSLSLSIRLSIRLCPTIVVHRRCFSAACLSIASIRLALRTYTHTLYTVGRLTIVTHWNCRGSLLSGKLREFSTKLPRPVAAARAFRVPTRIFTLSTRTWHWRSSEHGLYRVTLTEISSFRNDDTVFPLPWRSDCFEGVEKESTRKVLTHYVQLRQSFLKKFVTFSNKFVCQSDH